MDGWWDLSSDGRKLKAWKNDKTKLTAHDIRQIADQIEEGNWSGELVSE